MNEERGPGPRGGRVPANPIPPRPPVDGPAGGRPTGPDGPAGGRPTGPDGANGPQRAGGGAPGPSRLPRGWLPVPPSAQAGPSTAHGGVPGRGRDPRLFTHGGTLPDRSRRDPTPAAVAATATSAASPTRTGAARRSPVRDGASLSDVVSGTAFAAPSRPAARPGGGGPGGPSGPPDQDGPGDERPRGGWRRARRIVLWTIAVVVLAPVLAFAIGWIFFHVPTAEEAANNQIATVSYADGSPLASIVPEEGNRIKVPLAQVPVPVQEAVLSAEDRSFYTNYGFDPVGIARATWNQAQGGVGGGSTITQQYVKNVLVGDEYSLWRKYREVVIAAKVSQEQTKPEILENYLNTIYFGRGAYGIQAASQAYFGKDVSTLSPSEGAVLAGLIQAPSKWDPAVNLAMSQQRWAFVLDGMVTQNWLSPSDRAAAVYPTSIPPQPRKSGIPQNDRGHIVSAVRDELNSYGITEQQVNQEGLAITTTIDPQAQQQAADAATRTLRDQPKNLRTAVVSQDPRTGAIVAYYGGADGSGFDYAQTQRQPGSSFKPFVLLAGLERTPPIGLGTTFDGRSPQMIAGTKVENSEGESCPSCDLETAMTQSINTVFYQLGVQVGPQNVAAAAKQAGITAELPDPSGGISLGDKEVRPGDMASAYSTFVAGGQYHKPHLVSRVTTADGRVLFDAGATPGEQRFSPQIARNVVESMLQVADRSGLPLAGGRPVASKTGTVQSATQGQNNDAWMVGATPSLSTAVWIGTDDNSPIKAAGGRPIYGRGVPGEIWQNYMNAALRGTPTEQFGDFEPLGTPPQPPTPTAVPQPTQQICIEGRCYPVGRGDVPTTPENGGDTGSADTGTNGRSGTGDTGTPNGDTGTGDGTGTTSPGSGTGRTPTSRGNRPSSPSADPNFPF